MSVLERVNQRTAWPALVFKKLSNRTVVFREALPPRLFAVPYLPLMRGEIVVDHETSRAYVIGRLNPFFMTTTLCLMGLAVGASGDVANFILFVPLVALNVWLQWIRFGDVAKAITPSHEGIATN